MTLQTPKDDSECAYLVHEESLPKVKRQTLRFEESVTFTEDDDGAHMHSIAKFHEQFLEKAGLGTFHVLLVLITGLGLASDAIEMLAVAYILPSAEHELCIEEHQKGWIGASSSVGVAVGSIAGGILGDRVGRRRVLLGGLATSGIFGLVAAFMPTYSLLMATRFCTALGVGGSLSTVFIYFSEFLVRKNRGKRLSLLLAFWAVGGLLVALLAWTVVPRTGATLMDSRILHFGKWRKFLLLCSSPALLSAVGVTFLPESPRFLLEMGRNNEALYVYKRIFSWNDVIKSGEEYQLAEREITIKQMSTASISSGSRSICTQILRSLEVNWINIRQLFCTPYTFVTVLFILVWTSTTFRLVGVCSWLHEYSKMLGDEEFESKSEEQSNIIVEDKNFSTMIENTYFMNLSFWNVKFVETLLSHCVFEKCLFINCTFSNIRSSKTYFRNCYFYHTEFLDTDLHMYKFQSCSHNSSHFLNLKGGCDLDFDINFQMADLFYENVFTELAFLPGVLISSFILDQVGRTKTLGVSVVLSGLSLFCIWLLEYKQNVIAFQAFFTFLSTIGWSALHVMTAEAYPANIRATAFGIFSSLSRLANILSSVTFKSLLVSSKFTPVAVSSVLLLLEVIFICKLPETKDYLV